MRRVRAGALTALVLAGCCVGGPAAGDCAELVRRIRRCDPGAAGVPDSVLELQCPGTAARCYDLDVSTPEACTAFMGCLYDG